MRHKTHVVKIGNSAIGGDQPIAIQAMTNTDTADVESTVQQIHELYEAGAELVRVTVNTSEAAKATAKIKNEMRRRGIHCPLIGDFHFNGHILLSQFAECAEALDKYRINPGNVGSRTHRHTHFAMIVEQALRYKKPIRIGANCGSIDEDLLDTRMRENAKLASPKTEREVFGDTLVKSVLDSARYAEQLGMKQDAIVLSVKTSDVQDLIKVYTKLTEQCSYALHLGLTEAGIGLRGIVASSGALAILLQHGIGDTIRVSITPDRYETRTKEVEVCKFLLQVLGLRQFQPEVISCPGCGRTHNTLYLKLTQQIAEYISQRTLTWKKLYPGVENVKIAVMGCTVNGPGEASHADIAIMLPGHCEKSIALVYVKGERVMSLEGSTIAEQFMEILEEYLKNTFRQIPK